MVAKDVADHQDAPIRGSQVHKLLTVLHVDGQRLFDQHILAGFQCRLGHFVVRHRWCCQSDRLNCGIRQDVVKFRKELHAFVLALEIFLDRFLAIAQRSQRPKFVKIPNQVLSPISDSDYRNIHFRSVNW